MQLTSSFRSPKFCANKSQMLLLIHTVKELLMPFRVGQYFENYSKVGCDSAQAVLSGIMRIVKIHDGQNECSLYWIKTDQGVDPISHPRPIVPRLPLVSPWSPPCLPLASQPPTCLWHVSGGYPERASEWKYTSQGDIGKAFSLPIYHMQLPLTVRRPTCTCCYH